MTTSRASGGPVPVPILDPSPSWLVPGERPKTILDNLLARPDATRMVRATPIQSLYLFIQSIGLADAQDLIAMCLPAQLQGLVDLDVWDRDQLVPTRLQSWLAQIVELPPARFASHIRKLDAELLTTFLAPQVRVYDLTEKDEPPDEPEGMYYETPDRFFMVDILPSPDGDSERAVLIHRLLDHLYKGDLDLARAVINAARWDAGAETEELAYQFRSGRMADLGFVDYYEALRIYQEVDAKAKVPGNGPSKEVVVEHQRPEAMELGEVRGTGPGGFLGVDSGLWGALVPDLAEPSSLLYQVAAGLSDSERTTLLHELLYLANQAMSADRVAMDDLATTEATLQRTAGYLLLGLSHRLGSGPMEAPSLQAHSELLRTMPLVHLFRLGHSLTQAVRKLARILVESGATSLFPADSPLSLLAPDEAAMLEALLRLRPLYPRALSEPGKAPALRPFASLRDLARAAAFIEELSVRFKLLTIGLGLRHETMRAVLATTEPDARQATWDDVLGTMIGNHLLSRPPVLVPLSRRDLPLLRQLLGDHPEPTLPELLRARCWKLIEERVHDRVLDDSEARTLLGPAQRVFVERVFQQLAKSLLTLPQSIDQATAEAVPRLAGLLLA